MAKKQMIYRVTYSKERDAFETWVAVENHYPTDDEFGLELSCRCMSLDDEEPSLIHFSILRAISRAAQLGYKIEWRI